MNSRDACNQIRALSSEIAEKDHFGGDAFTFNGRMFATVWHDKVEANLRLSPDKQKEFLSADGEGFSQIENSWGRLGWTKVHLEFVRKTDFADALKAALEFCNSQKPASRRKRA